MPEAEGSLPAYENVLM